MNIPAPYWRLSGFYFFYFASIGAFVPYWSLYLRELGYSATQIGELMSLLMATKVVAPNVWAWVADRHGRRLHIIRLASFAAVAIFSVLLWARGYWALAVTMTGFSFFWHATLPQFEATTMTHLGAVTHRYSHIRLWGSVGFIVAVAGLAPLFDRAGVGLLPAVVLVLLAGIWLNTLFVPEGGEEGLDERHPSLRATLRRPAVLALLAACFFMQASHGPYYTFFSPYLEDYGYPRSLVGQLWALGVIAEVGVFLVVHRWLGRHGPARLLAASMLITALRWVLIGTLAGSLPALLLAQVMHAASYGVYHAAAIELVHRFFPGRLRGRGQALYSSLSFGLGGALGSLYSGYVWDRVGPGWSFLVGAGLALAGFALALILLRRPPGPERGGDLRGPRAA